MTGRRAVAAALLSALVLVTPALARVSPRATRAGPNRVRLLLPPCCPRPVQDARLTKHHNNAIATEPRRHPGLPVAEGRPGRARGVPRRPA